MESIEIDVDVDQPLPATGLVRVLSGIVWSEWGIDSLGPYFDRTGAAGGAVLAFASTGHLTIIASNAFPQQQLVEGIPTSPGSQPILTQYLSAAVFEPSLSIADTSVAIGPRGSVSSDSFTVREVANQTSRHPRTTSDTIVVGDSATGIVTTVSGSPPTIQTPPVIT